MAVDTKRQEIVEYYFQAVQDKIQELLKEDDKIKKGDIEKFNDLIFAQQEYEVRKDIEEFIENAASNAFDVGEVAKAILERYYDMVFVNNFNQDVVNDIENPLDERRIMTFEKFRTKK